MKSGKVIAILSDDIRYNHVTLDRLEKLLYELSLTKEESPLYIERELHHINSYDIPVYFRCDIEETKEASSCSSKSIYVYEESDFIIEFTPLNLGRLKCTFVPSIEIRTDSDIFLQLINKALMRMLTIERTLDKLR